MLNIDEKSSKNISFKNKCPFFELDQYLRCKEHRVLLDNSQHVSVPPADYDTVNTALFRVEDVFEKLWQATFVRAMGEVCKCSTHQKKNSMSVLKYSSANGWISQCA